MIIYRLSSRSSPELGLCSARNCKQPNSVSDLAARWRPRERRSVRRRRRRRRRRPAPERRDSRLLCRRGCGGVRGRPGGRRRRGRSGGRSQRRGKYESVEPAEGQLQPVGGARQRRAGRGRRHRHSGATTEHGKLRHTTKSGYGNSYTSTMVRLGQAKWLRKAMRHMKSSF